MPTIEPELTREAKEAVRGYLLKLLAPPAIVLSVLTFLLGYAIKDVAVTKAEAQAMVQIAQSLADARKAQETARAAADKAESLSGRLDTASKLALSKSDEIVKQVSESLLANAEFSNNLKSAIASGYVRLDQPYWITSGLTGLNLDVLYAKRDIGAPVGQAVAHPSQTWKIALVK